MHSKTNNHFTGHDNVNHQMDIASPFHFAPRQNKLPRNAFDMSRHILFSSPLGMMLPNFVQEVQPGDYMELSAQNFTRTQPLNTAAFARVREVTDFFFVPYELLWSGWKSFQGGVKDYNSTLLDPSKFSSVPGIPFGAFFGWNSGSSDLDSFGFHYWQYAQRLFELLGYPHIFADGSFPTNSADYTKTLLNPFRLLAWNKIQSDFYRLTDYEDVNPKSYNCDDGFAGDFIFISSDTDHFRYNWTPSIFDMVKPRYVPFAKDRFTGVKPSRNLGSGINGVGVDTGTQGVVEDSDGNNLPFIDLGSVHNLDAADLRNLLAVDRLSRISMLAPKYYAAQIKAHFGVDVSKCDACSTRFLGSLDSQLQIGEVLATAAGSTGSGTTSVPGQISGRGVSSGNGRTIKFKADADGIVMGVHYFIPQSEYNSDGVDDFNQKLTRYDYYRPEFDNLGLQPLRLETMSLHNSLDELNRDAVLGYQARYAEYKSSYDKVCGEFTSHGSLREWTIPRSFWALNTPVDRLRVNPALFNSVVALQYDGSQATDPFLCHFAFNCKMVRDMSVNGLPIL